MTDPTDHIIARRVREADAARSARRAAAATQIGDLAQHRELIADQLNDIERQLGVALAESADVIDIDELATFTDVPAADLTRWLANHKPARGKRKRTARDTSTRTRPAGNAMPSHDGAAESPKHEEPLVRDRPVPTASTAGAS